MSFQTGVEVVGGIFIGVIVILVAAVVYLFIKLIKLERRFEEKLDEVDPLKRYIIKRPHLNSGFVHDPSFVPNRFQTSESNFQKTFDTSNSSNPSGQRPDQPSSDIYYYNPRTSKNVEENQNTRQPPPSKSFLHGNKGDNFQFGDW